MAKTNYPSIEYTRQCFREDDGRIFWRQRPRDHFLNEGQWRWWNARYSGKEAGSTNKSLNRCLVVFGGCRTYRYIIVWALHRGEWPENLDHKDGNSLNDRIDNLRESNQSQNLANSRPKKVGTTSRFKGVYRDRSRPEYKKWISKIKVNYKTINIGVFDTEEEAHAAYVEAAKKHFGEFSNDT